MKELQTSLLREKFVIHDSAPPPPPGKLREADKAPAGPVMASSNRIEMPLADEKGRHEETIVIRAQSMPLTARMAARILQSYLSGGPLTKRANPYDWNAAWDSMLSEYELAYNPHRWVAIYCEGKNVFLKGEHHAFLDVIENCQAKNKGEYERSVPLAEQAFRQAGKVVRIEYDGNVALNVTMEEKMSRFGVIVRGPAKTTTFNFAVTPKAGRSLNFPQCLGSAAAFLEGIQLSFMVGMNEEKIRRGVIPRHSKEEKQTREARQRLARLNAEISTLEAAAEVRYRPERPEFQQILMEAEKIAKGMLSS